MKLHHKGWFRGLCLTGLAALLLLAPPGVMAKEIKVGILGPMKFVQGEHAWYGAELAAEEINKDGGLMVGGKKMPIKLVKIDTNEILSVMNATSAVEKAVTVDKVDFLVGGCSSGAILAMQDVAMDYKKIFLICGSGSHPEITNRVGKNYDRYKYFFRPGPINAINIVKLVLESTNTLSQAIRKNLGIKTPKVALLFEQAKWLEPQIPLFKKFLPKYGMEVAGVWRMSIKALDVSAQLQAIRSAGAHIILAMTSGPVAIPLYRQVGELQIPAAITGVNVEAEGAKFWQATGGMCVYGGLTAQGSDVEMTWRTMPFYKKFEARYKVRPILTASSYNSLLILAEAINRAGTTDAEKVVTELEKTNFEGTQGRVVFDKNHDNKYGPGFMTGVGVQWMPGGKLKAWWPLNWAGVTYAGVEEYTLSPWMVKYWKEKAAK